MNRIRTSSKVLHLNNYMYNVILCYFVNIAIFVILKNMTYGYFNID